MPATAMPRLISDIAAIMEKNQKIEIKYIFHLPMLMLLNNKFIFYKTQQQIR